MTTVTTPRTTTVPVHPFAGRSRAFPALLLMTGSALQVVEFSVIPHGFEVAARIAWSVEHPVRFGIGQSAGMLALPFLVGGFLVMGLLCVQHSRRLTAAAVSLLVAAMVGLGGIHGLELATSWLARAGHVEQAMLVQDAVEPGIAGVTLLVMFMAGALFGVLLLMVALWRSQFVPRSVVPFVLGFMVMDFFLGWGLVGHVSLLAATVILAWAVVTGYVRNHDNPRRLRAH